MKMIKVTNETWELINKEAQTLAMSPTMYIETIAMQLKAKATLPEHNVNFTGMLKKRLVQAINYKLLFVEVNEDTIANFYEIVGAWFSNITLRTWFLDMLKSQGKPSFLSERGSKFSIDVEHCKLAWNWNEKIIIRQGEKVLKGEQ